MMWIIIAIIVVLVIGYIVIYNGLVKARNQTDESWSQIDVQLKRRNDLIPNLVSTVKGYAQHEKTTLENVVAARNQMMATSDQNHQQLMDVSDQLSTALSHIFALSENYPDLKANQNFLNLQEELTNTENKIAYSRQLYNSTAVFYNNKLETFPGNVLAKLHHFKQVDFLQIPETEKAVPEVKF